MTSKKGRIFVISGPSGAGKNAVLDGLVSKSTDIAQTISVTTRAPRCDEVNGRDYYFVTKEEFLKRVEKDEFVEYVNYGENYYGTLKSEVKRLVDLNKTVILIIDVRGAFNFVKEFPEAVTVFILPPSVDELARRIRGRGENSEDEIQSRLNIALEELKQRDRYDYCIINDELDVCIDEVLKIINNN